jgi:hypothetical protein
MSSAALLTKARKAERRAAGLCVDCGKGPLIGTRCEVCTTKHRERQAIYQTQRPPRPRPSQSDFCLECIAAGGHHRPGCPNRPETP